MSFAALRWSFEHALPTAGLRPLARFVLLALANYADEWGGNCYPSVATICGMTGLSDRTVQSLLDELVQNRAIAIVRKGGGASKTTRYQLIGDFGPYQNPEAASGKSARRTPKGVQETPKPAHGTPKLTQENPEAASGEPVTEPVKEPVNEPGARTHCSLGAREVAAADLKPGQRALKLSDTRFSEWWKFYKRKVAKMDAEQAYLDVISEHLGKGLLQERIEEVLIRSLERFEWPDDPKYFLSPTTWLKKKRWNDRQTEPAYGSGIRSPL